MDIYIPIFEPIFGLKETTRKVKELIEQAKKNAKESGRDKFPPNHGDTILSKYSIDEELKSQVDELKKEGVKDEDIRNWWNMHYLEREMVFLVDNHFRLVGLINALKEFGDENIAANDVKKHFPIYGNYKDTSSGDDRPLPIELKDRINKYIVKRSIRDPENFKKEYESNTSFNSFIRYEIMKGVL